MEPGNFVITDEDDDFSLMMDKDDLLGSLLLPEFLRFVLNGETPARLGGVLAGVLGTKIIFCIYDDGEIYGQAEFCIIIL